MRIVTERIALAETGTPPPPDDAPPSTDKAKGKPKAGPVPREALAYFKKKKLRPAWSYQDVWQEEHDAAFTVAKLMDVSILETVRASIESAIENGTTLEDWKTEVEPDLERSGWRSHVSDAAKPSRLATIYETNMRVARAQGQHERIQRTKKVLPFLVYELGPSKEHRPEHVAWNGLTLPVDDPFWTLHTTPNGFYCKCRVRQISRTEADKDGGPDESPPEEMIPYELADGRTGEAPKGVDPSFAYPIGGGGREKALDAALEAADNKDTTQGASMALDPQNVTQLAHAIARGLSDGARRKLAEFIALCPTEFDSTGVSKFSGDEKTARKFLRGELEMAGLVAKRPTQERLGLSPTPLARAVDRVLRGVA